MKVLFVCSEDISLGVASLSAYLKKEKHRVFLTFDPHQFNKSYAENKSLAHFFSRESEILHKVKEISPDLICFSVYTANYQWALILAEKIKKITDAPIVFGGVHPTLAPEEVIKQKAVDIVCVGEGEKPIAELLENLKKGKKEHHIANLWFKDKGKIIKNEVRPLLDLNKLPLPDRDLFLGQLPDSYFRSPAIMTSKGCPFSCTFCSNNSLRKIYQGKGIYVRKRTVGNVMVELLTLKEKYRPHYFIFMDDLFTVDPSWLEEFLPLYRKKINLPFSCFSHFNFLDLKTARLLKKAGCNLVLFGLQSGSPLLRRKILKRPETNEDVLRVAGICREVGLNFSIDHIFNLPSDSKETVFESLNLYNKVRPNIINCYGLMFFPGTEIVDIAVGKGILKKDSYKKINEGKEAVYASLVGKATADDYRRFALLTTLIPLLPQKVVAFVLNKEKRVNFFSDLPISLIIPIKLILYLKVNLGFIFSSVIGNEFFYLKQFFKYKFKSINY